jgi:hypothetical protein
MENGSESGYSGLKNHPIRGRRNVDDRENVNAFLWHVRVPLFGTEESDCDFVFKNEF